MKIEVTRQKIAEALSIPDVKARCRRLLNEMVLRVGAGSRPAACRI